MSITTFENKPDTKISVKEVFGFDSDMIVEGFSKKKRVRAGY